VTKRNHEQQTTITKMDRDATRRINDALKNALESTAALLGLNVSVRGGTFDPLDGTFRPRIEFSVAGADRLAFDRVCELVGLTPEDFGREFTSRGRTFRVTGVNPRSPKFPIVATCVETGRPYKFQKLPRQVP
jgi:hypothetical protein